MKLGSVLYSFTLKIWNHNNMISIVNYKIKLKYIMKLSRILIQQLSLCDLKISAKVDFPSWIQMGKSNLWIPRWKYKGTVFLTSFSISIPDEMIWRTISWKFLILQEINHLESCWHSLIIWKKTICRCQKERKSLFAWWYLKIIV